MSVFGILGKKKKTIEEPKKRGFQLLSKEERSRIASMGGKARHMKKPLPRTKK